MGFFLPLDGWCARCHSSVSKQEEIGEIKTGGELLPKRDQSFIRKLLKSLSNTASMFGEIVS